MRIALVAAGLAVLFVAPAVAQSRPEGQARVRALQHYRAGVEFLSGEQFEKAAAEFRATIRIDALFSDAYYGLGQAHMGLRRYVSAAQAFQSCLEAARKLHALGVRDQVRRDLDRQEELLALRNTVRHMGPDREWRAARLHNYIAELERRRIRTDGPFEPPPLVLLALGSAHFRNGDARRAEYYWREAVRIDTSIGEAWNNLAAVYARSGRRDDAATAVASAERAGYRVNPQLKDEIQKLR
jgi:tetratricopeptide (TPR) repeat protein